MSLSDSFLQLRRSLLEEEYSFLNEPQRQAVFYGSGPLLILAGAGSGKTTVLVNKLGYLIKFGDSYRSDSVPDGLTADDLVYIERSRSDKEIKTEERYLRLMSVRPYNPYNLLAITFTNKAAGEMRERMERKFQVDASQLWAMTFHSLGVRLLRRFGAAVGRSRDFTIYDDDDTLKALTAIIKKLEVGESYKPKEVASVISAAKGKAQTAQDFRDSFKLSYMERLPDLYDAYEKELKENNALDFDDLILQSVRLLKTCPEAREAVQRRFHYVLVDEYQDTNPLQAEFVRLLAGNAYLCVVGDDDQSIYKFNGADVTNILEFERHYQDAKLIRLEQNYRSTSHILNAANEVIAHNTNRKGKTLWSDLGDGERICYQEITSDREEGQFVARKVLEGIRNGKNYSDFCVLYRAHSQSRAIETALQANGIPLRVYGSLAFYKRKEIQDLMAYMALVLNPADKVRFRRIVNEPRRSIGETTVEKVFSLCTRDGKTPLEICRLSADYPELKTAAAKLQLFADLIDDLAEQTANLSIDDWFRYLLSRIQYREWLKSSDDAETARMRWENVGELLNVIHGFLEDVGETATLADFVEQTMLMSSQDQVDETQDAVMLMTMHCSKGLEFENVFVVGFEEGLFPSLRSLDERGGEEEERRLCYVALTRAKKHLYLTSAAQRMVYGSMTMGRPSKFLKEIPDEHIEINLLPRERVSVFEAVPAAAPRQHLTVNSQGNRPTFFSQPKPAAKSVPKTDWKVGMRIRHSVFGEGTITAVVPMPNDCMITVLFDTKGEKKLMTQYITLTIL